MKNVRSVSVFALALSLGAFPSAAFALANLQSPKDSGSVNFLAVGRPSMLKIHGKAPGPEAKLRVDGGKLSGTATFKLDQLDTGIALRNEHMKNYLKTAQNPNAVLTLKDVPVDAGFEKSLGNDGERPFTGTLLLNGKEQPVTGTYLAKNGQVDAKFPVKLSGHGIEIPSYLGVTVREDVDVTVSLPLKKE